MSHIDIIRDAISSDLTDEDGEPVELELLPPMSRADIDAFAEGLPCSLPSDIRELLAFCRGFEGAAAEVVDFTGDTCNFSHDIIFPNGIPIASDGFGNFWVVDLLPASENWGPIYLACHDPPIILLQSPSLDHFLRELFRCSRAPYASLIHDVHEDRCFSVWRTNPGLLTHDQCLRAKDDALEAFANDLDSSFLFVDLRGAQIGFGFSWGRHGPNTEVRRFGSLPIFAYRKPQT